MHLPSGTRRLYAICAHLAVGASIWGYNIGILSSVLVHPGWRAVHSPTPAQRGLVTGMYYVGTLVSYLFVSHPAADALGRRHAATLGTLVVSLGAVVMASSGGLVAMVLGRCVCGLGVGVVSTTVPLYQSEVAPAQDRGRFATMNHVGFVAGLAGGLWVGYGMTFWTGQHGVYWAWRLSLLLQVIPAGVFLAGLPFLPDTHVCPLSSPRWLVLQGDVAGASRVLHSLRQDVVPPALIKKELATLQRDDHGHCRSSLALFTEPALRGRLWRAFLLQFMAQMCGATAIKYYLPTLLEALGLSTRLALVAGAAEMTLKIALVVVEMYLIDRFGRTTCLAGGSIVMGFAMLVNGLLPLLYPNNVSKVSDGICIAFIFIYAMGYSLGLGPAAWVYSSEIFPTPVRARGLSFAAAGGSIGSVLVSQIWPVGKANFGPAVYLFFMAVNFACVPAIWLLYPETKGRALEDMDALFGKLQYGHGTMARACGAESQPGDGSDTDEADQLSEDEPLLS